MSGLADHISHHESLGCRIIWLGIVSMPDGYALMLDHDETYFYWLRHDGVESCITWNRWNAYRGAKQNAARLQP